MGPTHLEVLFIGDAAHPEFEGVADALRQTSQPYREVPAVAQALEPLRRGLWQPDCIVLGQLWPGQFGAEEVRQLLCEAPLARLVSCLGTWCQGARRGSVAETAHVCLTASEAPARLARDLPQLKHSALSTLSLPLTASREEQLEQEVARSFGVPRNGLRTNFRVAGVERSEPPARQGSPHRPAPSPLGTIAVCSSDAEFTAILAEACQHRATRVLLSSATNPPPLRADCLVWDGAPWPPARYAELSRYHRAHPNVRVVAIADFPRPEDDAKLLQAGAAAVLPKPLLIPDLLCQLEAVTSDE